MELLLTIEKLSGKCPAVALTTFSRYQPKSSSGLQDE